MANVTPPSEAEAAPKKSQNTTPLNDLYVLNSSTLPESSQSASAPTSEGSSSIAFIDRSPHLRRGRRRRSSEQAKDVSHEAQKDGHHEPHATEGLPDTAPLLWWQRSREDNSTTMGPDGPMRSHSTQSHLPPLQVNSAGPSSSSPDPSIRSPAAAFLSSMNEILGSPPSVSGSFEASSRAQSLNSRRQSQHFQVSSMPNEGFGGASQHSAHHASDNLPLGLGTAAAHLFEATSATARIDDEGARIGPGGRFLLGKTIGFGGSSTIREAWDLGRESASGDRRIEPEAHKVAVKIAYTSDTFGIDTIEHEMGSGLESEQELQIWETIPAHSNLLPLLHHERIVTRSGSGSEGISAISFLVMPFCEGSLLTYVRAEGSMSDTQRSSDSKQGLSRSASFQSSSVINEMRSPSLHGQQRTGSGFAVRSHGMRMASVPLSSILGRSPSLAASSQGGSQNSSLMRRASSRISQSSRQSNGIPLSAAKMVMRQLTDALMCLHLRAGILHGDLKLENVLGQPAVSHRSHPHQAWSGEEENDWSLVEPVSDAVHLTSESICWRLADFGLAKRVSYTGSGVLQGNDKLRHSKDLDAKFLDEKVARARKAKSKAGGAGGSLAYTAPEAFLPQSASSKESENNVAESSPFAPDMWALGCILYALCSGKLPFRDSFEPRLQMKIAKGVWEMPARLRRRGERKATSLSVQQAESARSSTRERESSGGERLIDESKSRNSSLSASLKPQRASTDFAMDMSASMPALQERRFFANGGVRSASDQSVVVHDVVDNTMEENEEEGEISRNEESSYESDQDEQIDQQRDAKSRDRVYIRRALRGLLEPDPRKRWTIEQMNALPWIAQVPSTPLPATEVDGSQVQVDMSDELPSSLEDALRQNVSMSRPSLAHAVISEHVSQEAVSVSDNYGGDKRERGRSTRRETSDEAGYVAAKPIDIDRSTSRSRSRPAANRETSPWRLATSFERALRSDWDDVPTRRRPQRSTSADALAAARGCNSTMSRGRRSASRPPQLDSINPSASPIGTLEKSPPLTTRNSDSTANRSSTSRSRSRARDILYDIATRSESRDSSPAATAVSSANKADSSEESLWWQRGRR